jgi:hypothetical protein
MALVSADTSAEIKNITLDGLVKTPLRQAASVRGNADTANQVKKKTKNIPQ